MDTRRCEQDLDEISTRFGAEETNEVSTVVLKSHTSAHPHSTSLYGHKEIAAALLAAIAVLIEWDNTEGGWLSGSGC